MQNKNYYFWFLVSTSVFLIMLFVYYLPLRFQHQAIGGDPHGPTVMMDEDDHGHEEVVVIASKDIAVDFSTTNLWPEALAVLKYALKNPATDEPIGTNQLTLDHGKVVHSIGVSADLETFFHLHPWPALGVGNLEAVARFPRAGNYKFWSEIVYGGAHRLFSHSTFTVGAPPSAPARPVVDLGRNRIVNSYQVSLATPAVIKAGRQADLTFDISTVTGNSVILEPYLEALMHLAVIKDDLSQFVHAHPDDGMDMMDHPHSQNIIPTTFAHGGEPIADIVAPPNLGLVDFHVNFPTPGNYKLFAQFRPQGVNLSADQALVAAFWVEVVKGGLSARGLWWLMLILSLVLMTVLSLFIRRVLKT